MTEIYDEFNESPDPLAICLVLVEPETAPPPQCGNCRWFVQSEWHRSVFEGKTGYCWTVNQGRRKTATCADHEFNDEF
jgi:hypothetical protein